MHIENNSFAYYVCQNFRTTITLVTVLNDCVTQVIITNYHHLPKDSLIYNVYDSKLEHMRLFTCTTCKRPIEGTTGHQVSGMTACICCLATCFLL